MTVIKVGVQNLCYSTFPCPSCGLEKLLNTWRWSSGQRRFILSLSPFPFLILLHVYLLAVTFRIFFKFIGHPSTLQCSNGEESAFVMYPMAFLVQKDIDNTFCTTQLLLCFCCGHKTEGTVCGPRTPLSSASAAGQWAKPSNLFYGQSAFSIAITSSWVSGMNHWIMAQGFPPTTYGLWVR